MNSIKVIQKRILYLWILKILKHLIYILCLTEKINLKRSDKCVALLNLSIYYIWKYLSICLSKISKSNRFKMSTPA